MALSPESAGRRANLIREMSRQSLRSHSRGSANSSDAGSDHISAKDWGTESQQLPALPAFTPERYAHHDAEYQINTSALRRAFPDFSQHGSSDEDSIEIGRGLAKGVRDPMRVLPSEDPSENISLNFGNGERYTVTGTPPMKPKNMRPSAASTNGASKPAPMARTTSEKENQNPAVKHTSYGSSSSSSANGSAQKKQPTVYQSIEEDDSLAPLSRPKSHYASAKSTRFMSPPARQPLGETQNTPNRQPTRAGENGTFDSVKSAAGGTYQSFALPDMPNMTELMTGSRRDATPQLSQSAKARSRSAAPGSLRKSQNLKSQHNELVDVPVPEDAKALHLALQLLQEKVQALEQERNKAVQKADSYELEVLQLRSKVEDQDATNNNAGDLEEKTKEWETERAEFERSIKVLQKRMKEANKKLSTSEATIKTLTNDRDAAQKQLNLAYVSSDELKTESQGVQTEIQAVKAQLTRVTKQHQQRIADLESQELELRGKIERREKAVNEMASMAKELWDTRHALARSAPVQAQTHRRSASTMQPAVRRADVNVSRPANTTSRQARPKSVDLANAGCTRARSNFDDFTYERPLSQVSNAKTVQRHRVDPVNDQHDEQETQQQLAEQLSHITALDLERCETYLSFMEGDEVAKLRQVLKEDKARLTASNGNALDYTSTFKSKPASGSVLPRKSSLKNATSKNQQQVQYEEPSDELCQEITGDISRPVSRASGRSRQSQRVRDDDPLTRELDFEPEATRDVTQQSMRGARSTSRRRKPPAVDNGVHDDNMTSEFILPDITMTGAALASTVHPKTAQTSSQINNAETKDKATIKRPVPVSERPVSPTPSNPDPTLRPSCEPGVALSLVIRSLEDEIARLREQLAKFEDLYQQTDPSLSKRRRKAVWARIVKIGDTVERRADQVYALYDVLEGLKQSGMDMKKEEVEVTLAELGVDAAKIEKAVRGTAEKQARVEEESDDELPFEEDDGSGEDGEDVWEGFGTTQTGMDVTSKLQ